MNRSVTAQDKVIISHDDMHKSAPVKRPTKLTFGLIHANFAITLNIKFKC